MLKRYKTIIIGEAGSGKSYEAIKMALNNKGTTIIVNGCTKRSAYEDFYPELKEFVLKNCNYHFDVEDGKKYMLLIIELSLKMVAQLNLNTYA